MLRRNLIVASGAAALAAPSLARRQAFLKITLGISGLTGFAPLPVAEQAGLFTANGIEVETRFVPQREHDRALVSGAFSAW